MSIEWVNGAIEEIRAWGRSKDVAVDVDEVRLLCDYASDYLDVGELSDFTPGTFEQLLLDIYPRKVIAPPESAAETVAAARTLVDFLLDSGEIGAKMATRMRSKIDDIAPEMPGALADTSKFGMAKSIFGAMGADADAPGPVTDHQGRRLRGVTADDECGCPGCSPLPPVRPAAPQAIARAVRGSGLLRDAHALLAWMLEGGRTPTVRGTLRVRDAARVTRELGLAAPALAWELVVAVELAEVSGASVRAPGLVPLDARGDEEVLDLWAGTVTFLTGGPAAEVTGWPKLDRELYTVHESLYRLRGPMAVQALREHLDGAPPDDDGGPEDGLELDLDGDDGGEDPGRLDAALAALARCGTVERRGDTVRLTAQGLWGMREMFSRMGLPAPVAPGLADGGAAELIAGLLEGMPAEQAEPDIASWLERRTQAEAASDLLSAVRGEPAVARGVAVTIVDRFGAEAAGAVRPFLDDPELRPHVVHWLAGRGLEAPALSPGEVLWASVDMLALAVPAAGTDPGEFAETLAGAGPPAHVIEEMWQVDHPDVAEVLDLLGRHLPDRDLAKAARKAAFKARSRGIH
ncbi:hypothetical protein [Sphaerisporangium corydalis]|uniref:Uncharacterized protein n=1 Tax=Sphaerisporangium corydalis TaxID=1441875 RepID=A0ABV9EMW0_9ACTN|nr:hypothetical protein [Sphaerisporangium corydalis]